MTLIRTRMSRLIAVAALLAGFALLAGCGGSDGNAVDGSTDPQTILDSALGGSGEPIESGVLDLSLDIKNDDPSRSGTVVAALKGPFQSSGDGTLPQLQLAATAKADTPQSAFNFDGGLTVTSDAAYVSYAGDDFEVDPATFSLLQDSYAKSSQAQNDQKEGSLSQFGIDPESWLSDLTNEGVEDLDGTEVVHVSGSADVGKIVTDLSTVAAQTGQASPVDAQALSNIEDSFKGATVDVYATTEDAVLRSLDLKLEVAGAQGSAGTSIALSIGIADPGGDQEFTAPTDPKPIQALINQFPGATGGLGALQGLNGAGGGTPPADNAPATGGPSGSGSEYLDCAAAAKTQQELSACDSLLGG